MATQALTRVIDQVGRMLDRIGLPWALIGGLAVSARTEPRFTRDIDIAVAVEGDTAAEQLVFALQESGLKLLASIEQEAVGRLATVRLVTAADDYVVDLLFASSGVEAEIARDATRLEIIPGLEAPVARTGHLIALKVLSVNPRRLQDGLDLRALLERADANELALANEALALVTARGFHRGRKLEELLRAWERGEDPIPN